jgi:predicted RNA binding protein YcfA (HicA-like mRNA interferase family)
MDRKQFPKKPRQILKLAQKGGADVREGGSHTIVEKGGIQTAIPRHAKDLPTGTHHSIWRDFLAMGLILMLLGCAGSFYFSQVGALP